MTNKRIPGRLLLCVVALAIVSVSGSVLANEVFVGYVGGAPGMRQDFLLRFTDDGGLQDQIDIGSGTASSPIATDGVDLFIGHGNRIERYSRSGDFLGVHATLPESGIFFMHRDPDGNFYAQVGGSSAYRVDPLGIITPLPTVPQLYSVVGGNDGKYYVSSRRYLYTFDRDGNELDRQETPFYYSGDLAIDHETDTLFLLDQQGGIATYDTMDTPPVLQDDYDVPLDLALYSYFDPYSRNLFVSGLGGVLELAEDGQMLTAYQAPNSFGFGGVAVLPIVSSPEPRFAGSIILAALWLARWRRRQSGA